MSASDGKRVPEGMARLERVPVIEYRRREQCVIEAARELATQRTGLLRLIRAVEALDAASPF